MNHPAFFALAVTINILAALANFTLAGYRIARGTADYLTYCLGIPVGIFNLFVVVWLVVQA